MTKKASRRGNIDLSSVSKTLNYSKETNQEQPDDHVQECIIDRNTLLRIKELEDVLGSNCEGIINGCESDALKNDYPYFEIWRITFHSSYTLPSASWYCPLFSYW
jgi:hypothetical protein